MSAEWDLWCPQCGFAFSSATRRHWQWNDSSLNYHRNGLDGAEYPCGPVVPRKSDAEPRESDSGGSMLSDAEARGSNAEMPIEFKRMPKQPSRGSMSFTSDEVLAVCRLFETVARGGDARVLVRSKPAHRAWGKFFRMKQRLEERGYGEPEAKRQEQEAAE